MNLKINAFFLKSIQILHLLFHYQWKSLQFPIQNCYALTVYKTQGLTLCYIPVSLDNQIFAHGQAYTALSRCPNWDHIQIAALDRAAFKTDPDVIR
ncbi:hypothetical protein RclHR1_00400006 [Rhizophagus clarus]|uniref:UvrD-like helicase C-terminal domain-containing protein n=1 Tax=Rhizophagus clarus TaxID=94130 RepID=A0A2Z6RWI3_9GLOM|nr:hypothetical protein RclHR1_00400006 [Rhizophagus clarus]